MRFSFLAFINYISGVIVFIYLTAWGDNRYIYNKYIVKISKIVDMYFCICLLPGLIAILQGFGLVPLSILNFKFVNYTIWDGETLQRANGYLHHGIELTVIIYFAAIYFLHLKFRDSLSLKLIFMLFILVVLYFLRLKSAIFLFVFLFGVYFVPKRFKVNMPRLIILLLGLFIVEFVISNRPFTMALLDGRLQFNEELFTGRGGIWNVYLKAVQNFNWLEIIFGYGFGSSSSLFSKYSYGNWNIDYIPGPHNLVLDVMINGGVVYIITLFLLLYKTLKIYYARLFDTRFTLSLLLPIIVLGVTSPLFNLFVFWVSLAFILIAFKKNEI
jgi:O-antigen ligase